MELIEAYFIEMAEREGANCRNRIFDCGLFLSVTKQLILKNTYLNYYLLCFGISRCALVVPLEDVASGSVVAIPHNRKSKIVNRNGGEGGIRTLETRESLPP